MKEIWLGVKTILVIIVGLSLGAIMITVGFIVSFIGALEKAGKVQKK